MKLDIKYMEYLCTIFLIFCKAKTVLKKNKFFFLKLMWSECEVSGRESLHILIIFALF